jgi:DNA-directed RNA polymerase specialized sigma24 family protein
MMYSENQSNPKNQAELVSMASKRDLNAFNQLMLTFQDLAYHHAYGLLGDPPLAQDATQESFIKAFHGMNVYRMLDELPDVYRSVLTLIDLYEFDYAEAAKALKIPVGTVKSRLARARFQIKKKLTSTMVNEEFSIGTSTRFAA